MKASSIVAALALAITSVSAQAACDPVASAIPTCGVPCIQSAASGVGCDSTNYRCRCSSSSAIQASAQGCVINNCGIATALQVQASASAVCACVATAPANFAARHPHVTPAPAPKF
ncbi:hypothetical protein BS50DRAFT_548680 [Corynespora cassiicola Philippines]|uniref:CFEM domain-containing protein n=1 Tax=Corynespora cassiicola Philippines TaxID=1448308 RepID=A0A2T2NYN0_CORCC|nr:hypothetical protein BS50DRAFT_548680 [Corynespora cassiicola Philippines]